MSLREALNASIIFSLFLFWQRSYTNSLMHRLLEQFRERTKIYLKYSFFGRTSKIGKVMPQILPNSQVVQYFVDLIKKDKNKLFFCLTTSSTVSTAADMSKKAHLHPWKIISPILLTIIIVNTSLSFIVQKQINLSGWIVRGLLLLIGINGFSCKAAWPIIKADSFFLRKDKSKYNEKN